jgi:hypothetical protein
VLSATSHSDLTGYDRRRKKSVALVAALQHELDGTKLVELTKNREIADAKVFGGTYGGAAWGSLAGDLVYSAFFQNAPSDCPSHRIRHHS